MNNRRDRAKFKNFCVLLESGSGSRILMGRMVKKLGPEENSPMQWNTQAGNITTDLKVKIDFTLPALRAMNVVTWNFHVDDSAKGRYDMILSRYLLTELGLNLKFSEHVIKEYVYLLTGLQHPWLIWVRIYLNI